MEMIVYIKRNKVSLVLTGVSNRQLFMLLCWLILFVAIYNRRKHASSFSDDINKRKCSFFGFNGKAFTYPCILFALLQLFYEDPSTLADICHIWDPQLRVGICILE